MRSLLFIAALPLIAAEPVDLAVIHKIKAEAFERSKVMEHLSYLTDVYGPRLTASPEFQQAAEWALKRLQEYGLENARMEKWGPFGRSWSLQEFSVEIVEPRYGRLTSAPLAWTASTPGPIAADPVLAPLQRGRRFDPKPFEADLQTFISANHGKLKGKIVLISAPKAVPLALRPLLRRFTDAELAELETAPAPRMPIDASEIRIPADPAAALDYIVSLPEPVRRKLFDDYAEIVQKRNRFLLEEGVAAVIMADDRAHAGLVFVEQAGSFKAKEPLAPPAFNVTEEDYGRLVRLIEKKIPVRLRVNLKTRASDADLGAVNLTAEIPGTAKRDELVMVGAHFDSWHSGTGATDNAAGSAVMMEVLRILKALNLKMDRTVRIGLWSGEEQGLLGSKAYVKEHFGDPATMRLTAAHARFAGYFNLDNGSGKIRGVYLQGNDAMRPVFETWLEPFHDLGAKAITIRNTGGTDHLSFDAVGLPGFQFIQDPLDYGTVTHHSDMDVYGHAIAGDLMQASAIIASMVYHTATRPELLPRKPLPKPQPASAFGQ